jgi:hypothetical protein
MSNFLFDLVANLAILAMLLVTCRLCNLAKPELALNGGSIFVVLIASSIVFDAALTFLVFADAPSRYAKFSSTTEFTQRASAYAIVCALAAFIARRARLRTRPTKDKASDAIVIRTSAYIESQLPK